MLYSIIWILHLQALPLEIGLYFVLNPWSSPPYKMTMAHLSRNYQSLKSTHIMC